MLLPYYFFCAHIYFRQLLEQCISSSSSIVFWFVPITNICYKGFYNVNVLPCKTKETLYRAAFILPHFDYCSQIWHHCGTRNTKKLDKINERALRFVYKDKSNPYDKLVKRIGLQSSLEVRRIQDTLITINSCFCGRAPIPITNLFKVPMK